MTSEQLKTLESDCEKQPHDIQSLLRLGCAYHTLGRFADAFTTYENILQHNMDHLEANLLWIVAAIDVNEYEEASRRYQTLAQQSHHIHGADLIVEQHKKLAQLYKNSHNQNLAAQELKRALDIRPLDHEARIALAKIYIEEEDYRAAHLELQNIITHRPSDDQALTLMGLLHQKQGETQKAYRCLQQASRLNHQQKTAHIMLNAIESSTA